MNYDFYKTFVILAETKNFSKTAEKLNIVQSTVSNRIQELEKYLQTNLLYRTNKSVKLTQSGLTFLPYAKRIVSIEEECLKTINKLKYKDSIKIGTVHPFYSGFIKNTAKKFMKIKPNVSIEIIIDHTPNLLEMLSDHLIDLGFICTIPKSNKFVCSNILNDEIILVTKNTTDFKDVLEKEELHHLPLLYADTGVNYIKYIEEQIDRKLEFQFSISQVLEIIAYLREGYGYSFVLKSLVASDIQKGELKEVKIKNTNPSIQEGYLVVEKNKIKREPIEYFIQLLSEESYFMLK